MNGISDPGIIGFFIGFWVAAITACLALTIKEPKKCKNPGKIGRFTG